MIGYLKTIYATLTGWKNVLFGVQGINCVIALGFWTWDAVTLVKMRTLGKMDFDLYPWTYYYFHPVDSSLFNYFSLCVTFGLVAAFSYCLSTRNGLAAIDRKIKTVHPFVVGVSTLLSLLLLASIIHADSFVSRSGLFVLLVSLPLLSFAFTSALRLPVGQKAESKTPLVLSAGFLLLLVLEPLRTIQGPVYLLNDYPGIFGTVKVKNSYLDNRQFLEKLENGYMDTVKVYLALFDEIDIALRVSKNIPKISKDTFQGQLHEDEFDGFNIFRDKNLQSSQEYLKLVVRDPLSEKQWESRFNSLYEEGDQKIDHIDNIKKVDMEMVKQFYLANYTEYWLQNMGRGQIHHIGHLLNPINEHELGKPLNSIFLQYGIGTMLLTKWYMELFGGLSIQNFYKTYVYYILYFLFFLLMTLVLFKDHLYSSAAFSILPASFFFLGYFAYVLAPGFIPVIHILDGVAIVFFIILLRSGRLVYLAILAVLAAMSIFINGQFGLALSVSLFISLLLYVRENKQTKHRYLWSLSIFAGVILAGLSFKVSSVGVQDQITPYFWVGWLSWPVNSWKIDCTIFYLVISYLFIFLLKSHRVYLKYVYVAIFLYAQILLLYYFWSGVPNHIPTVFPFLWVQLILMLYIGEKQLLKDKLVVRNVVRFSIKLLLVISMGLILKTGIGFYTEKALFDGNFKDHKIYRWEFERARVVCTIDPALIQESIDFIDKYSRSDHPSIHLISKYDCLLPFLAGKCSAMGFFELGSFIFSEKESGSAINAIRRDEPEYIFVDSNIEETSDNLWSKMYRSDYADRERASRLGRYVVLRNIFGAIEDDYQEVEKGSLISVYKRRPKSFSLMKDLS